MSMQDPISDMLTRVRNAQMAGKKFVDMPGSKLKAAVAQVLEDEGYISGHRVESAEGKPRLSIELKYYNGKPVIAEIERFSKPSLRRYAGKDKMPNVRGGLGVAIVSTSKGVMTDRAAKAQGVGGEVLCTVF
ncbi:MAG: 30S ribosomal protein S8 [Luminiphilus sp.]|jgi:small subunit ribosomal protein S8|uniref:Small ribosomal subunit protein uS8 n=1 Tax=Candidatus Paraluminiphilus aquimaris TaxID=2518994 RepID=A0ABY6Q497_9GAMM|nr:30S ribosomal protein S8 [Candidatus Paraluminiphilus aquimaris]MAJ54188.1 30S ribosomal protein S8 [Halieaceae bacterium]MCH1458591.1 30S ribosomal protein S8 [Luminiphilus sp.]OUU97264.1 MAG: 30S ribosomal protein S8 [Cellvibrionales bacterium TMED79]UZP74104.1 30S ribosomal protein S8 [Candidatus Paraluminiphilus aquimaris]